MTLITGLLARVNRSARRHFLQSPTAKPSVFTEGRGREKVSCGQIDQDYPQGQQNQPEYLRRQVQAAHKFLFPVRSVFRNDDQRRQSTSLFWSSGFIYRAKSNKSPPGAACSQLPKASHFLASSTAADTADEKSATVPRGGRDGNRRRVPTAAEPSRRFNGS